MGTSVRYAAGHPLAVYLSYTTYGELHAPGDDPATYEDVYLDDSVYPAGEWFAIRPLSDLGTAIAIDLTVSGTGRSYRTSPRLTLAQQPGTYIEWPQTCSQFTDSIYFSTYCNGPAWQRRELFYGETSGVPDALP